MQITILQVDILNTTSAGKYSAGKLKEREDSTSSSSSAQSKFYYTGRSVNQDNSNAETTGYSSLVSSLCVAVLIIVSGESIE